MKNIKFESKEFTGRERFLHTSSDNALALSDISDGEVLSVADILVWEDDRVPGKLIYSFNTEEKGMVVTSSASFGESLLEAWSCLHEEGAMKITKKTKKSKAGFRYSVCSVV